MNDIQYDKELIEKAMDEVMTPETIKNNDFSI
jgi:hypothetical protein